MTRKLKKPRKPITDETRAKLSSAAQSRKRGDFDISEEEIAARAAEIREEWPPERLEKRNKPVEVMVCSQVSYQDHTGEYS